MARSPKASPPNTAVVPAPTTQNSLATAVGSLDFDPNRDTYKISGAGGIASIHVKKPTGEVYSARVAGVAFKQFTVFDPAAISVEERRRLEFDLVRNRKLSQAEAGDLLGVPQSLVSKDLKLIADQQSQNKQLPPKGKKQ